METRMMYVGASYIYQAFQKHKIENKGRDEIFEEIMAENFPEWNRNIRPQVEEIHQVPSRINKNQCKPRHLGVILKDIKDEEKNPQRKHNTPFPPKDKQDHKVT